MLPCRHGDDVFTGGLRKASASVTGQEVYRHLKFEVGVHRVQRVPQTEKSGRIHTSTMTVAVLPQPTEVCCHWYLFKKFQNSRKLAKFWLLLKTQSSVL